MKLGAEPKKLGVLVALVAVALYFFISGSSSDAPSTPTAKPQQQAAVSPQPAAPDVQRPAPATRARRTNISREFRPKLGGKNAVDPTTIDPTLKLDLLAKVQSVKMEGNARNLFQFGPAPAPKVPDVKVVPKPLTGPAVAAGTMGRGSVANGLPPKPPPPAIPLKFYGYVSKNRSGVDRRAFFIEGDEIFVAGEGELIKQRYKVMRIGVNSAVVQDMQFSHEQTLPLEEQTG